MLNDGRTVRGGDGLIIIGAPLCDCSMVYFIRFILGVCRRIMVGSLVCRHETKYSNFIMIVKVYAFGGLDVSPYIMSKYDDNSNNLIANSM